MGYGLAVWEGPRPEGAEAAIAAYLEKSARWDAGDHGSEPSPRISAYVEVLLSRWPDVTDDDGEDSPWSDGPLIGNALGDGIYFEVVWSAAEEASEFAARTAAEHSLVCFDPQTESLRP
jgi:hypothetical protein